MGLAATAVITAWAARTANVSHLRMAFLAPSGKTELTPVATRQDMLRSGLGASLPETQSRPGAQ